MIEDLLQAALSGNAGDARETARTLSDPALLAEFQSVFGRKLKGVERKIAYEYLGFFAHNCKCPAVATFVLSRLGAEKAPATQLAILNLLWLLDELDSEPIEPFLASADDRLRFAAMQALAACKGERPAELLGEALRHSAGGEETRQCAKALARCGNEASVDIVIEKLGAIEKNRRNMEAEIYLLLAAQAIAGPRHHAWFRNALTRRREPIHRWLVFSGFCKHATPDDCDMIEAEVADYLEKPTGPFNLLMGLAQIKNRDIFQIGMSELQRLCPDRFGAMARKLSSHNLPSEDRAALDILLNV